MTSVDEGASARLWVCHDCERIGSRQDAHMHRLDTGHGIGELSQEVSDGVREEWARERARRIVGFVAFAGSRR